MGVEETGVLVLHSLETPATKQANLPRSTGTKKGVCGVSGVSSAPPADAEHEGFITSDVFSAETADAEPSDTGEPGRKKVEL